VLRALSDMNETIVVVSRGGAVTPPTGWREKYGIQEGDALQVLDLDGVIVLTPNATLVPQLAQEIERLRLEAGVTTDEMLEGLQEQREQYYVENHAFGI